MTGPGQTARPGVWAIVPVKPFDRAKSRLSAVLAPADRAALAEAMFRDVLAAVRGSGLFDGILVATGCRRAGRIARWAGAEVLADGLPDAGTNRAVEDALAALPADAAAMVVQADLPLLRAEDLAEVARAHRAGAGVTLVPALDGGTTVLALSPARAIRPAFGARSFAHHRALADAAGLVPVVLRPPRAVCDLDRPEDISLLWSCRPGSQCARLSHLAGPMSRPFPKPTQESMSHDEGDHAGYASVR